MMKQCPKFAAFCDQWAPRLLSVLRIVAGLLFMEHGTMKLFNFPPSDMFSGAPIELFSLMGIGGLLELVGGALLTVGLFTRPVAFILSGEMAVAYFMFHAPQGFFPAINKGEAAILYCFLFLYFFVKGPGPWSLDARCCKRNCATDKNSTTADPVL